MDDVENRYGGWADFPLSPTGIKGAKQLGRRLKKMNLGVNLILTSPLKRAVQTAEEISRVIGVPIETSVYLKERNTYGLLCGERKEEEEKKYPELVATYEKEGAVLGYEDYRSFLKRVKIMIEKLSSLGHSALICVTHSKLLGALFKDILKIEVKKFHDNCLAEIEVHKEGSLSLVNTDGVSFVSRKAVITER